MLPLPPHWRALLTSSARGGDTAVVEALLLRGANANDNHDNTNAPFHLAVVNGHIATALLLAEHGATSVLAQCKLGYRYLKGTGVRSDLHEAITWLTKSAHQGFALAWNQLGWIHQHREDVQRNLPEAERCYRHGAMLGYSPAKVNLAVMLQDENNPQHNKTEAFQLLLSAANQGNVGAQDSLGVCLMTATGTEKNADEALRWFRRAAGQGFPLAQFHLGEMFLLGEGVQGDPHTAVKWFRIAADNGLGLAQCLLGKMLLTGKGIKKDTIEAEQWLLRAVREENAEALYLLGWIHINRAVPHADLATGMSWLCMSAELGYGTAQRELGRFYLCPGPQKNTQHALFWLRKAREYGDSEAGLILEKIEKTPAGTESSNDPGSTQPGPRKTARPSVIKSSP